MIKTVLGIRWVGIVISIIKWGSVVAVIGYISWTIYSNIQLREELAVVGSQVNLLQSSNTELKRRISIAEQELSGLQTSRRTSRRELEEFRRFLNEWDIESDSSQAEEILQRIWDEWTNELREMSNN